MEEFSHFQNIQFWRKGEGKGVEGGGKKDHDFFPHTQVPLAKSHLWLRVSLLWLKWKVRTECGL